MAEAKTETAKKSKSKSGRSKQASTGNAPKLKVVIRRLPPNLPENIFWQSVSQWVTDQSASWKLYVPGKLRTKLNRENTPSRAYVEFVTPEAVVAFNRDYNGHVFRDKQGNESIAVVEYALYQKVPHEKRKVDSKAGTIETDEDFLSFLEALNKPAEPTPDVNELVAQALPSSMEPSSTPLLDALKAAKEASTIKGYHSHYREQSNQPRTRAQQLEDEETFNRKAPLLPKSQQDPAPHSGPSDPPARETEKGREKEKEAGGRKGKNKQKATGPKSPKPAPATPQSPTISAAPPNRPTADTSRSRPVVGIGARGGLLAALGAATEARSSGTSRKASKQRQTSGGAPSTDAGTQPTAGSAQASTSTPAPPPAPALAPAPSLPAGVIAIPSSSLKTPDTGSAPPKNRRGKNRARGGGGKEASGSAQAPASAAPTALADMPRIDDPGQALPPAAPAQRARGGNPGRGRGRGRGRGGRGTGGQPDTPAT